MRSSIISGVTKLCKDWRALDAPLELARLDLNIPLAKAARFACLCPHAARDFFVCCFVSQRGVCLIANTKIRVAIPLTGLDAAGGSTSVDRGGSQFAD